jgi:hypothetical protein
MSSFSITFILTLLLCFFNFVRADYYYLGPSLGGGIGGLVRLIFKKHKDLFSYLYTLDYINP